MNTDITQTTQADINNSRDDFSVDPKSTDGVWGDKETIQMFDSFTKWYGYYSSIPELKKAIQVYATWVLGQGYETDDRTKIRLEGITGSGEDSFTAILWNMLVMKKVNGDSFAEIIRNNKGTLINLKPLDPARIKVYFRKNGTIKKYSYLTGKKEMDFLPSEIFHLVNDRVADNTHGDSVVESIQWLIDARQEAMRDWRRISHRSTVRILYVEEDNPNRLANLKTDYKEAINNGNLLILPVKAGDASFADLQLPPIAQFLEWIRYTENAFYKAVGTPKTLAGDADGIPESGGKMVVLTHEPTYVREVKDLENDLWNQLAIKVEFNRQASLQDNVQEQEGKSNNQTQATQPGDTKI